MRAAVQYIDTHGLPELTMRRLAATLGVEAMSLYKHVAGRDNLLDTVVESVIDELYGDPDVHLQPSDGWQDYLRRLAHGVRRVALDHPQVFPLIATRPPAAPWIRPPLRSLRWIEAFLGSLRQQGFDDAQAVDAYKAFTSFLLGHLLLEVSQEGAPIGPEESSRTDDSGPPLGDLTGYPTVRALAPLLADNSSEREFETSLENLIDRLALIKDGKV